jgi:YD repeat-containing protein
MKNKLLLLIFPILFLCLNNRLHAAVDETAVNQLIKPVIPPNPTAAAFARYGEYPVSLSTGVPQIDIPIYTIEMNGFKLPISISYHASGNKVSDVATPVGLGWVLNAGGIISRSTCGKADLSKGHTMTVTSAAQVTEYMSNNTLSLTIWDQMISGTESSYDSQSDRYSYNFNGKAGIFREDIQNDTLKTIPYSPIKIKIISTGGYKITDTDGMEYYFQDEEKSNVSSPATSSLFTTSWYMSKIKNPNTNDSIRFIYKSGTYYTTYYPSQCVDVGAEITYVYGSFSFQKNTSQINDTKYSWTRIVNEPILIDSIVWNNNAIKLTYESDRSDINKDRLTNITVSSNGTQIKEAVFDNNSYWGSSSSNYRMRLDGLTLQGTDNSNAKEKYSFTYDPTALPGYYDMTKGSASIKCSEDYWGYFNGIESKYLIPSAYCASDSYSKDRTPKEVHMKACILTQIEYPTGGKTVFDYEINKVTYAYDYSSATEAAVGGLRIKTITNKDADGTTLGVKNYEYSGTATNTIRSEMYTSAMKYRYCFLWHGGNNKDDADHDISVAQPVIPLTDNSGSPVFYSTVTEYNGTSSSNNGKIVYEYMQDLDDICECESSVPEELIFFSEFNNCDQGILNPLLQSKITYKNSGNGYVKKQEVINDYTEKKVESFITGVTLNKRDVSIFSVENGTYGVSSDSYLPYDSEAEYYDAIARYDVLAFRGIRVLASTTTTDYDDNELAFRVTKIFTYDPSLRIMNPVQTTQSNSTGGTYTTINTHPFDYTGTTVYNGMTTANYVEPVVKSMEYMGSTLVKTTMNDYKAEDGKYLIGDVQLANGSNSLETRIVYNKYDSNGNPLEIIIDDNTKIVYLWGYNERYPVAKIEGLSYDEVKSIVGEATLNQLKTTVTLPESLCQSIRSSLSGKALVTSYTYSPLIGITSITAANGKKATYTYDDAGRLIETLDHNNKTVEEYEYNYQQ